MTDPAPRLGGNLHEASWARTPIRHGWSSAWAAAGRGRAGPADTAELQDDAIDTAIRDQEEAGIDVVSDDKMRRGILHRRVLQPPDRAAAHRRTAGQFPGHDQQHRFEVVEPIAAPDGLGRRGGVPLRPNPDTPAAQGHHPRAVHAGRPSDRRERLPDRVAATEAFIPILADEVRALVAEGATFIQIDEPSPAIHPDAPADFAALFNPVVANVP